MAGVTYGGPFGPMDNDGSSSAAHRAPTEDTTTDITPDDPAGRSGFLKRLFGGARSPSVPAAPPVAADVSPPRAMPGLKNLRLKRLDDVLIPRAEVVAVPVDISLHDLVAKFRESGMTRLPVFQGTLDEPLGMIHLKDLSLNHGFNGDRDKPLDLEPLIRPLIYAPPSMPIGVLLTKMQTQRIHMALVIDEYGGVDGLVTLEDLIEQVIGEIEDEHDQEEGKFWRQEKSGCYLALARTPLSDFEAEIGFKLIEGEDEEEIDTLGGLVFILAGRVPARGEVIPHASGAEIEVVDADPRRIKRLRLRMPAAA
ncbi:conjugation transfer protein [Jannaschia pagri]|uniref:Conjugation transfer protein n=1 Tax=Jannaschia pagri TaxID=2829797 RepID=A0ABQ4NHP3_9RHOB|nr:MULTISPECIES: hemolysin family protein [unclassified Jannaschia]GIT89953.1 conjugation transfer protein [Jannaschia sp. AI_61]GIT93940.1 conjugation transfer protein [Jannaschia sp. AI_62]